MVHFPELCLKKNAKRYNLCALGPVYVRKLGVRIPKCLDDSQTQPVPGSIPNLAHFNHESTWKISPSNVDLIFVTSIDILILIFCSNITISMANRWHCSRSIFTDVLCRKKRLSFKAAVQTWRGHGKAEDCCIRNQRRSIKAHPLVQGFSGFNAGGWSTVMWAHILMVGRRSLEVSLYL